MEDNNYGLTFRVVSCCGPWHTFVQMCFLDNLLSFYIAELKVTGELLEGLSSGENAVFSEEQVGERLPD